MKMKLAVMSTESVILIYSVSYFTVSATEVDLTEKYRRRENTTVHVLRGRTTEDDRSSGTQEE
jgi:hypothetical protein